MICLFGYGCFEAAEGRRRVLLWRSIYIVTQKFPMVRWESRNYSALQSGAVWQRWLLRITIPPPVLRVLLFWESAWDCV